MRLSLRPLLFVFNTKYVFFVGSIVEPDYYIRIPLRWSLRSLGFDVCLQNKLVSNQEQSANINTFEH